MTCWRHDYEHREYVCRCHIPYSVEDIPLFEIATA